MCDTHDTGNEVALSEQDGDFMLLTSLPKEVQQKILQYVKLKCKEQRELCLSSFEKAGWKVGEEENAILFANEPDVPQLLST